MPGIWDFAGVDHYQASEGASGITDSSMWAPMRAFYTTKDDGAGLGLAIRCASTSNKIELRATLIYSGGKISGKWEERQFNAGGSVTGSCGAKCRCGWTAATTKTSQRPT